MPCRAETNTTTTNSLFPINGFSQEALVQAVGRVMPWMRTRLASIYAPKSELMRSDLGLVPRGHDVEEWVLPPLDREGSRIKAEVRQWAVQRGIFTAEMAARSDNNLMTEVIAGVLHDADPEVWRAVTMYWDLIINLDDDVAEAGRLPDTYPDEVWKILVKGRMPADADAYHLAFRDLREHIIGLRGRALLRDFADSVADSLAGWLREQQWRLHGSFPTFPEYLRYATATVIIEGTIILSRLAPGGLAPGKPVPTQLAHLVRTVTTIIRLTNDVVGTYRETQDGSPTALMAVMKHGGLSPTQASSFIIGSIDSMMFQYDDLAALIRNSPSSSPQALREVELADRWLCACYAWDLTVTRQKMTDPLSNSPDLSHLDQAAVGARFTAPARRVQGMLADTLNQR